MLRFSQIEAQQIFCGRANATASCPAGCAATVWNPTQVRAQQLLSLQKCFQPESPMLLSSELQGRPNKLANCKCVDCSWPLWRAGTSLQHLMCALPPAASCVSSIQHATTSTWGSGWSEPSGTRPGADTGGFGNCRPRHCRTATAPCRPPTSRPPSRLRCPAPLFSWCANGSSCLDSICLRRSKHPFLCTNQPCSHLAY